LTRFIHWSDLHTESHPFELPTLGSDFDAILIGGDTAIGVEHVNFLEHVWDTYRKPVISIWGNHEPEDTDMTTLRQHEDQRLESLHAKGADIRILHAETTQVGDATVFGATLWTDFQLYPSRAPFAKMAAQRIMSDYRKIKSGPSGPAITPDQIADIHQVERKALLKALDARSSHPMVVMTHHVPSERLINPRYHDDLLTAAFASNLDEIIHFNGPDFWVFGHTHSGSEMDIHGESGISRMRHNPRGVQMFEYPFDPYRVIDTNFPEVRRLA
jgi:predicted phosphodiesterase